MRSPSKIDIVMETQKVKSIWHKKFKESCDILTIFSLQDDFMNFILHTVNWVSFHSLSSFDRRL